MYRWLVWNLFFPLHEWVRGHQTLRILKDLEAADHMTTAELEELRAAKLREFIQNTYADVPYVQRMMLQAGVAPSDIRTPADLARLPVMRKADVRKHRDSLRSKTAGPLRPFSSGGSTGEPLVFDLSKPRIAVRVACRQRVSRWWGLSAGDPEIALWGSPLELSRQEWMRNLRDRVLATKLLSAYEMNEATMSRYLDILETTGCKQIFTYPSSIYLLSRHAKKQGRNLRRAGVRVVFVTSEVLFPYQRDLIVETFGCPVANGYGGRDSGFISHECPQGGMHIMADAMIVETVDPQGQPVPPGEAGEILATDLYSHDSPFLRYATGDIGVISTRPCPCGRPLPLFERIDGRSNDCIVTPDGRAMHGQSLISLLMEIEGIEQFRIFQKRVDCFNVQMVTNERFQKDGENQIRRTWSARLRSPLEVTFEYFPALPAEASGKFRHIVSEVFQNGQSIKQPLKQ